MNIFVLDLDPVKAAQYQCDKHVVKMVTETAQLLSNAYHLNDESYKAPYKPSHINTRLGKWSSESLDNWEWLCLHGIALYREYKYRFYDRTHKAGEAIFKMAIDCPDIRATGITQRPLNMPEQYKCDDVVKAYRDYYLSEKSGIAIYTRRKPPDWF